MDASLKLIERWLVSSERLDCSKTSGAIRSAIRLQTYAVIGLATLTIPDDITPMWNIWHLDYLVAFWDAITMFAIYPFMTASLSYKATGTGTFGCFSPDFSGNYVQKCLRVTWNRKFACMLFAINKHFHVFGLLFHFKYYDNDFIMM